MDEQVPSDVIIVSWSGWVEDARVERAVTWENAERSCEALENDRSAIIVDPKRRDGWSELDRYRGRQLYELYTALGGELVESRRFTNYDSGRRRIEALIERLAKLAPIVEPPKEDILESETTTTELVEQPRKFRAFKPPQLGVFSPVRPGTKLARVLELAAEGTRTLDEIAVALGADRKGASLLLRSSLAKGHGIGHNIDEEGIVTIVLPPGKSIVSLTKAPAEPRPRAAGGAPRRTKHDDAMERARQGVPPPHLVITSEANKHRQRAVDRLEKLVADGDWDGVSAFRMNGIDTYSKMINRHRDLWLAVHEAQQQEAAE